MRLWTEREAVLAENLRILGHSVRTIATVLDRNDSSVSELLRRLATYPDGVPFETIRHQNLVRERCRRRSEGRKKRGNGHG